MIFIYLFIYLFIYFCLDFLSKKKVVLCPVFHDNIVKITEHLNMLKTYLQFTYPTGFCIICNRFWTGFPKTPSFKIVMSGRSGVWHQASGLLVNLFSKLCVTFILQWIAFIFGRDEEEDQ